MRVPLSNERVAGAQGSRSTVFPETSPPHNYPQQVFLTTHNKPGHNDSPYMPMDKEAHLLWGVPSAFSLDLFGFEKYTFLAEGGRSSYPFSTRLRVLK